MLVTEPQNLGFEMFNLGESAEWSSQQGVAFVSDEVRKKA
jgi:hypothetical protein